jgi:phosphoesterase RecJ-like protein
MQKDVESCGAHPSETEGFVDFIMGIDSVEVGATVMEMGENKYKISLRSKGVNVNAVAGSFGGGGHILASGCQINGEYEEVIDKLSFAVSRELID